MFGSKWFNGTLLALGLTLSACGGTTVQRTDVNTVKDLSGFWNDTDSRLTAEAMVKECLDHSWYSDYKAKHGDKPKVIVGTIINKSSEHIATDTFIDDLKRALVNSGQVGFVADKGSRNEIREEKADQSQYSREETRKEQGQETGADFMLQGTINTIIDSEGREQIRFYQVDLKLTELLTHEELWLGQKKIKKDVKGASSRM